MGVGNIRKPVDCMLAPKVVQVCEELRDCIPVIEVYNVANRISTSIKLPGNPPGNKCNIVSSTKIENIKRNRMQSCTRTPISTARKAPWLSECYFTHLPWTKALNALKANCIALSYLQVELLAASPAVHIRWDTSLVPITKAPQATLLASK